VLDSAVDRLEGPTSDGDVVDLLSDKGKFIARGIFNSRQPHPRPSLHMGRGRNARRGVLGGAD